MSRLEEDIGRLLKETGQCVKADWEREREKREGWKKGGLALRSVSGLKAFLKPARVPFVC